MAFECGKCSGSGRCQFCHGTGKILGNLNSKRACETCKGSGVCYICRGKGKLT
jgi:hypothetical protein